MQVRRGAAVRAGAVLVASGVATLAAFGACKDDSTYQGAPYGGLHPNPMTAVPSCGKEGDRVTLTLTVGNVQLAPGQEPCPAPQPPDPGDTRPRGVSFVGATGEIIVAPMNVREGADSNTCIWDVVIPKGAISAPLRATVQMSVVDPNDGKPKVGDVRFDMTALDDLANFEIPCPPAADAGADADAADTGTANEGTPGGVFHFQRYEPSAPADTAVLATFWISPRNDAELTALLLARAKDKGMLAPSGVKRGTCAAVPDPAPVDGTPPTGSAGDLTVSQGGSTVLKLMPQQAGPETQYAGTTSVPLVDVALDVAITGGLAFPAATIPSAVRTAPANPVTSPDLGGPSAANVVNVAAGADLTFTYGASSATDMTIWLRPAGKTPIACVADPKAGSLTIPSATLGDAGIMPAQLVVGSIADQPAGGRTLTFESELLKSFSIQVN